MKKLLQNEKGSALLMVILMMTIFSILGLAVLKASLSGAVRTETKEEDIRSVHEAQKAVQQGTALLQAYFEEKSLKSIDTYENTDIAKFNNLELTYEKPGDGNNHKDITYTIKNITGDYGNIDTKTDYTRVFKITSPATDSDTSHKRTFSQKVILSATPTALQHAVGAGQKLILNGSPEIHGDVFTQNLIMDKNGYYIYSGAQQPFKTPQFTKFKGLNPSEKAVLTLTDETVMNYVKGLSLEDDELAVEYMAPEKYQAINVQETYEKKRNELYEKKQGELTPDDCLAFDANGNVPTSPTATNSPFLLSHTCPDNPVDENGVTLDVNEFSVYNLPDSYENEWIIVDGDLNIVGVPDGSASETAIKANFLVDGDIYITGNVTLESTIYALGDAEIHDANIQGNSGEQLALFTDGKLILSRINEYEAPEPSNGEIKAFLYSSKDIDLYAVGSFIHIIGGIFSEQTFTINAARGNVTSVDGNGIGMTSGKPRLIVKHDPKMIFNAGANELPFVDKLYVFTEGIKEVK
ncbi:hypothetical protein LC040_12475 [Bacillus tianshenii]|nr:hypothetical protein LC040_12475 [Bacillus tianshenii]